MRSLAPSMVALAALIVAVVASSSSSSSSFGASTNSPTPSDTNNSTPTFISYANGSVPEVVRRYNSSSSSSSSSGSHSWNSSGVLVKRNQTIVDAFMPCNETAFYSAYDNLNVTNCAVLSGFSFTDPNVTAVNATSLCRIDACYYAYENISAIVLNECYINSSILLYRDILQPLTDGNCSTVFGTRSWSSSSSSSSGSNAYDHLIYSTDAANRMLAVRIVTTTIGMLAAFTVVVVAIAWYKRQRLLHFEKRYNDPLIDGKQDANRPQRQVQGDLESGYESTEGTDSFPARGEMALAARNLQQPHSSSLWADEELMPHHMRNEDLEDIRVIGYGGHGVVFLVRYRQSRLLASKRLVKDNLTREKTRGLLTEIKLVAKLEHPCIVQFVGAAWTTESDLQALFEYMPNGDLCTYLAKTITEPTWNLTKLRMAMDIAEALIYVHSFAPPLVHRDLKSNNVLLTDDMRAKLSDFGVSRFQSDACTMTLGVGSGRWLAPEVMAGGGEYNQSCDVYSMGVVLSEMDTHRLPFSDLRSASGNPMAEVSILQLVSLGRLKPTFSDSCPASIRAIALRCLAFNPKDRPSAIEVSYTLRTIAKNEFSM